MDLRWWLVNLVLLAALIKSSDQDAFLQSFQPKQTNPRDLNEFLANVFSHQKDFSYVREAARKYQKMKKDTESYRYEKAPDDSYNDWHDSYKYRNKRNARAHHKLKKKAHQARHYKSRHESNKNTHRVRRHIDRDNPEVKKFVTMNNLVNQKIKKHKQEELNQHNDDVYYVDLPEANTKNKHSRFAPFDDSVRNQGIVKVHNYEYFEDGGGESAHPNVDFEKALTYEIPLRDENVERDEHANNPKGNSLISVDEGRADQIQPFNNEQLLNIQQQYQPLDNYVLMPVHAEDEPMRTATVHPEESGSRVPTIYTDNRMMKQMGNGFVEVAKQPKDEEKPVWDRPHMLKKRVHRPIARYQLRKLQFLDSRMEEEYYNDDDYEGWPRERRNFMDVLGMKNEDDESEDNPHKADLKVNNTVVDMETTTLQETRIVSTTVDPTSTDCQNVTEHSQKIAVKNIKKILEEPKVAFNDAKCKSKEECIEKRRSKKERYSEVEDFDDVIEEVSAEPRKVRNVDDNVADRIMEIKDRVANAEPVHHREQFGCDRHDGKCGSKERRRRKWNYLRMMRSDHNFPKKPLKKKEEFDLLPTVATVPAPLPVPDITTETLIGAVNELNPYVAVSSSPEVSTGNYTELNFTDFTTELPANLSEYEDMAHNMDSENQKLAQLISGNIPKSIVCAAYDVLEAKDNGKNKIYSGLTRKHGAYFTKDAFKLQNQTDVDGLNARLLIKQITQVMNHLILNEVRRRICTHLPDELKIFLTKIVEVDNCVEVTNSKPNTKQGDFLFAYQDDQLPPFDVKKLQNTLVTLEGLLLSYSTLNGDSQTQAGPVKDYIDRHVKMLRKIVACPTAACGHGSKRNAVEDQLESLGLGRLHQFVPNFDVGQIVKNNMKGMKSSHKRDTASKTAKYRKLEEAVDKVRGKRENERKIGEMFGEKKKRSVDYEEPVVYSLV